MHCSVLPVLLWPYLILLLSTQTHAKLSPTAQPEWHPRFLVQDSGASLRLVSPGVGGRPDNVSVILDGQDLLSSALDFCYQDNLVFYVDDQEIIRSINVNTKESHVVMEGGGGTVQMFSLSVDWITKKVYWSLDNQIAVSDFDGANWKVLLYDQLEVVRSLSVDPIHGYMFWFNGYNYELERSWMDGTNRTQLFKTSGETNCLYVDFKDSHIYWSEAQGSGPDGASFTIRRSDLSGNRVTEVARQSAFYMVVYQNELYFHWFNEEGIKSCYKVFCKETKLLAETVRPDAFRVYEQNAQPQRDSGNPCALKNGGCSHLCLLIPEAPYRSCACPTGIRLLQDRLTCAPGPEEILIVATRKELRYISLDTPDFTPISIDLIEPVEHAVAVDFDPVERFIYWTDGDLKKIRRARLNGTGESDVITTELHQSDGLAVDWIARNLYWTDTGLDRIEVARLDGSARRVLISTKLGQPRAIVLDPLGGFMYWSDWDDKNPCIEKSFMDGSNRLKLLDFGPGHWPNGLALDKDRRWIYWIDGNKDVLEVASALDGSQRATIITDQVPHMFGLTMLDDWLYWTDWQRRSIERVHPDGTQRQHVDEEMPDVMGIKAVNLNKIAAGSNQCAKNNGGCSHLCLHRPIGHVCLCAVGWELAADNHTCHMPNAYLMFTQRDVRDIMRISLESFPSNLDRLRLHNISQPLAIDFHLANNHVYWTSGFGKTSDSTGKGAISRAFLNGSHMETVIKPGAQYMEGLAVDWVAKNLYWSEWTEKRIEVSRLDGSQRSVIVWEETQPRAIMVHPTQGYLYWADWRVPPTLQRSELDGKNRVTLFPNVGRINAIALDAAQNRLYWADIDAQYGALYSADINGGARHLVLKGAAVRPYAMTYFKGFVYWASWDTHLIEKCDVATGKNRSVLHSDLSQLLNLIVVHPLKQTGWNQCAVGNGGCQHLCFSVPNRSSNNGQGSVRCGCATHYDLENGKECSPPSSFFLVAHDNQISRWKTVSDFDSYTSTEIFAGHPTMALPFETIKRPRSLMYDPMSRIVYWIDSITSSKGINTNAIRFARDNETKVHTMTLERCTPFAACLDVFGRQMFVNCMRKDKEHVIRVFRLRSDGSLEQFADRDEIIRQGRPQQMAIHPTLLMLFYVDVKGGSRLFKCKLDGSDCQIWPDANTQIHLQSTSTVMVDDRTDTVFWSDTRGIQSSSMDGQRHAQISNGGDANPLMASLGSYLFASADRSKSVRRFVVPDEQHQSEDTEGVNVNQGGKSMSDLSGLLIEDGRRTAQISNSPCLRHHRCSHMCALRREEGGALEKVCLCPAGMSLSRDRKTCRPNVACQNWHFACRDGQQCIHMRLRCDGNFDCNDRSDEASKMCHECNTPSNWLCTDGSRCLKAGQFCDGRQDCTDNSDESHCFCPVINRSRLFDCALQVGLTAPALPTNHRCIERNRLCDGHVDCTSSHLDEMERICRDRAPPVAGTKPDSVPNNGNGTNQLNWSTLTIVFVVVGCFGFIFCLGFVIVIKCKRTPPPSTNESAAALNCPSAGTLCSRDTQIPLVQLHVNQQVYGDPTCSFGSFERFHQRSVPSGKSNTSSSIRSSNRMDPGVPPNSEASYANASDFYVDRERLRRKMRHRRAVGGGADECERLFPMTPPPPYDSDHMTPCSTEVLADASGIQMPSTSNSSALDEPPLIRNPPPSPQTSVHSGRRRRDESQNGDDSDFYANLEDPYQNPPPSPANGSSSS